jgi:phosphonate transport system permease protein
MTHTDSNVSKARALYLGRRRVVRMVQFAGLLLSIVLALWTIHYLNIPISRLSGMLGRLGQFLVERLLPPDMPYVAQKHILYAVVETFEMSILSTFFGGLISVPLAWFAAWNVTPSKLILYPLGRGFITFSRAIPEIIWAMILVVLLGFGPVAGTIALLLGTIGFAGKLMSEQVEAINMEIVEAIRATGAGEIKTFVYGILPQVKPAWIGIIIYNWDSIFRASTILGFVGAGGIGLYIRSTTQLLEYQKTMSMIGLVIVLVYVSELLSYYLRKRLS